VGLCRVSPRDDLDDVGARASPAFDRAEALNLAVSLRMVYAGDHVTYLAGDEELLEHRDASF